MTRRLALLLAAALLPALLGSLVIHTLAARDVLLAQLALRNGDAATALAVALSQLRGDKAAMETVAEAQFSLGHYREMVLEAADGTVLLRQSGAAPASGVPAWFGRALPLEAEPGRAPLSDGWRALGTVRVMAHTGWAQQALWTACTRTAALLAALALAAAALGALLLRGWRRPLQAAVAQAQALGQAHFVEAPEPGWPELREMTRAMNSMVRRVRALFDAQAEQVARLQRQAQTDGVTGLPVRSHFMGRLGDLLAQAPAPALALLLVRVPQLERLNERHGREATDRLLGALADVLLTYVERVPGTAAGRLNGSDFALCLPAAGVARETAESVSAALAAAPAARLSGATFVIGGCDGLRGVPAGAALAAADAALARSEAGGEGAVVEGLPEPLAGGARAWREQIAGALEESRVELAAQPVSDRRGVLVHLECTLRMQMQRGGEFLAARRWLALATRSRLMHQVDLAAVERTLAALGTDARPRCVQLSLHSLAHPEFTGALQARLEAAGAAARVLAVEWTEIPGLTEGAAALRQAMVAWHRLGVTVGVRHAGASPKDLPRLKDLGLDHVKVEARHLRGVALDAAIGNYAQGLVALIHSLEMRAYAHGIDDARDLQALWDLGFDGASGPAVPRAEA